MNTDFRISVTLTRHPKTRRLLRRLGHEAFYNLICLWTFTAVYKPRGVFSDMTAEEIEDAAEWDGEPGEFVRTLLDLRLLDEDEDGTLRTHDWREHNGYASSAQDRSDKARKSSRARWEKEHDAQTGNEHDARTGNEHDAQTGNEHDAQTGNEHDAPSPSPSPSPSPTPNVEDVCAEPARAPSPAPPPALVFPLAGKDETFPVTEADIAEWRESFPGVDVPLALRACLQWNRDNPTRRKTRSGIRKHICAWLTREQNAARASPPSALPNQTAPRLTPQQRYMQEVAAFLTEPEPEPGDPNHAERRPDRTPAPPLPRALPAGGA